MIFIQIIISNEFISKVKWKVTADFRLCLINTLHISPLMAFFPLRDILPIYWVLLFLFSIWTGPPPRPPAASIRPANLGSAAPKARPSCSESSVCRETSSAATAGRPTLAGPPSTLASCCVSSVQESTGTETRLSEGSCQLSPHSFNLKWLNFYLDVFRLYLDQIWLLDSFIGLNTKKRRCWIFSKLTVILKTRAEYRQ